MEVKYQTEKKQKEIEILNKEKTIQTFRNRVLFGGIIVLIIIAGNLVFAFLMKRRDNRLLHIKNEEIQKQREEIQIQADYLAEANHEITIQKDLIQSSHEKITDSINYAKRIQGAVMPSPETISAVLPESFILFHPCNIVSGDFYFIKKIKNLLFIAAADCTGHGVPGAFMSMLGVALLNDLVQRPGINSASELLDQLRIQIKMSLQQTGQSGEQKEGMDIAFCILNTETNQMSYSGAYNPLWLFRKNTKHNTSDNSVELIEYPANRQPVGIYLKERPFVEHTVQLQSGDMFYLFSDGYYSQFGGENGEKLKISRFRKILTDISTLPVEEQKNTLDTYLNSWKGSEFQTDDILVVGVRVS